LDWGTVLWIAAIHAGAVAAPFYFTWSAFGVFLLLSYLTGSWGICLTYHRCLTHRSLKLAWPVRWFFVFTGAMAGQGTPLAWTALHRIHHARSDKDGDPHSPRDGAWWSHIWWVFRAAQGSKYQAMLKRYVPDLMNDPVMLVFEKTYGLWMLGGALALYALGGLPFLTWGLCVRMVLVYHSTWFVNSATHLWGYRNYETTDDSRNLWWVALLTYGEGWHNNHHAFPRLAPAGHRWWEFDATYWVIRGLEACGLATEVCRTIPEHNAQPSEHA